MTNFTSENTTKKYPSIQRIAAVHDLCGYGKCSLGVALPVLSAAGFEVCPVPSGLFSMHTAMSNWVMMDTSKFLPNYIDAWQKENVKIDYVYSGFLSSDAQVNIIEKLYKTYPEAMKIVDPVMADNGQIYKTYTPELCQAMKRLATSANLLTPNTTEACILTGRKWSENISVTTGQEIITDLHSMGAKNVVLKGIIADDGKKIINLVSCRDCQDKPEDFSPENEASQISGLKNTSQQSRVLEVENPYLPYKIHGTGDLYCSCLLSKYLQDGNLYSAAKFASEFIYDAILLTIQQPGFEARGISFEPLLGRICK